MLNIVYFLIFFKVLFKIFLNDLIIMVRIDQHVLVQKDLYSCRNITVESMWARSFGPLRYL